MNYGNVAVPPTIASKSNFGFPTELLIKNEVNGWTPGKNLTELPAQKSKRRSTPALHCSQSPEEVAPPCSPLFSNSKWGLVTKFVASSRSLTSEQFWANHWWTVRQNVSSEVLSTMLLKEKKRGSNMVEYNFMRGFLCPCSSRKPLYASSTSLLP